MGFVVFALMLAVLEVWATLVTPGEMPMPQWMRLVGPVLVAASAYKRPRRERGAMVVLGAIFLLTLNRTLVGAPALVHVLVWAGCAYVGLTGLRTGPDSSFTAKSVALAVLMVVGTVVVFLLLFPPL